MTIDRPDQVWSADVTYLPLSGGFMYLAATIDWFSRCVVAWRLSNTLDGAFCRDMLDKALGRGRPEVFNTDRRCSTPTRGCSSPPRHGPTGRKGPGWRGAWTGEGAADNVFVERLWRTVTYEDVYLRGYESVPDLERGLRVYSAFYNHERLHQSLGY